MTAYPNSRQKARHCRAFFFFDVSHNQLTGSIPSLAGLTALTYFYVNNNQLTGPAPVPPPNPIEPGYAALCPNFLGPESTPKSATDLYWENATDDDPWTEGCTLPAAAAIPAPALTNLPLSLLIGLPGIAGCLLLRPSRFLD